MPGMMKPQFKPGTVRYPPVARPTVPGLPEARTGRLTIGPGPGFNGYPGDPVPGYGTIRASGTPGYRDHRTR
eukprot:752764-Hanusia_phi.AAC.1